jgi:hypothetical protein
VTAVIGVASFLLDWPHCGYIDDREPVG